MTGIPDYLSHWVDGIIEVTRGEMSTAENDVRADIEAFMRTDNVRNYTHSKALYVEPLAYGAMLEVWGGTR